MSSSSYVHNIPRNMIARTIVKDVASDDLRDALSAIFGLSELKEISKSMKVPETYGDFVLGCSMLKNMVVLSSDKELEGPMKDQPLSADVYPTALSPGYIANFDPKEDKEDPEEDLADHPANG
ncbi:hypothetical protein Tco_0246891 [Tanacetum coccineum]